MLACRLGRGGYTWAMTTTPTATSERPLAAKPVPCWAVHRRLYDWVLSFSHSRHASSALFVLSFAESSFFPIPPDILLAPLCLGQRKKAIWFASITTLGSVLGAMLGYLIGWGAWDALQDFLFSYVPGFSRAHFETVEAWYRQWGIWVLFAAAFTPIPFKVFTIAGGVFAQSLVPFLLVSLVGRALRFFLVAGIFWAVGPKAMPCIDRYFNLLCIVFTILLIGGFLMVRMLH